MNYIQRAPTYAMRFGATKDGVVVQEYRFLGVYSGRIGANEEFKAQLGGVWKAKALYDLVDYAAENC